MPSVWLRSRNCANVARPPLLPVKAMPERSRGGARQRHDRTVAAPDRSAGDQFAQVLEGPAVEGRGCASSPA